jgi:hypothetical protein
MELEVLERLIRSQAATLARSVGSTLATLRASVQEHPECAVDLLPVSQSIVTLSENAIALTSLFDIAVNGMPPYSSLH